MIRIQVNGRPVDLPEALSVARLLETLGIPARGTAVEVDGLIVARDRFEQTRVDAGAGVEIVRPIGGG